MPQILIATDGSEEGARTIVYRERIAPSDLESDHFSGQLVERVGWAVLDADEIEQRSEEPNPASASAAPPAGDVELDRMDLALAVGAGLDRSGGADQSS
jgi:hypothetical protein